MTKLCTTEREPNNKAQHCMSLSSQRLPSGMPAHTDYTEAPLAG